MNWEDERYVRLYTRDTADWMSLRWEAKALFPLLLRKSDRAGIVQVAKGEGRPRKIAGLVGLPADVVEPGLADLLADGVVTERDIGYCFRNFLDAQEAPQSDAQRQRESRARRRDLALSQGVTGSSHDSGQNVTSGHTVSPRAVPSVPSTPLPPARRGARRRRGEDANGYHYAPGVPAVDRVRPDGKPSAVIHLGSPEAAQLLGFPDENEEAHG